MNKLWMVLLAALLSACAAPPSVITEPTTARPQPLSVAHLNNGAIFQSGSAKLLFEEPVARYIGDTLVVMISESLSASNSASTSTSRAGAMSTSGSGGANIPHMPGVLEKLFNLSLSSSSSQTFDGSGAASNTNTFTGSLAVTVIDVLPNGNLLIGGEKRVSISGQINNLRLTGVVNPRDIAAGNVISSTKVADARIEQAGEGTIAETGVMGWMARFFHSVLPM